MVEACRVSERRACRLAGLSRDTYRHPPVMSERDQVLQEAIIGIARQRRRFGYRRVIDLLRVQGFTDNHKRVFRLYRDANLAVGRRRRKRGYPVEAIPLASAQRINEVWSMDFVSDSLANGRRIKCLTVADDFSHECVELAVDFGMGGECVVRLLEQAARFRGYPEAVRTDQGPEFTSRAFLAWTQARGIRHLLNAPGKPTQNAYIESFNGKFRDECLNEHWFESLAQARNLITEWRRDYNEVRPHSSIGRIPPAQFAAQHRSNINQTRQESTTL